MSRIAALQKKNPRLASQARRAGSRAKATAPVVADNAVRYAATTREWAAPKVDSAVEWAGPRVDSAVEWAAPKVVQARDWVAPKVEPAVDKVRSDVLPAVVEAVTTALTATEPARSEAASRGSAALAALKGEIAPPKKTHKVRTLLLLLSAAGAAVAGWRTWLARQADPVDAWTTPSPRPTPTVTPVPVVPVTPAEAAAEDELAIVPPATTETDSESVLEESPKH